MMGELSNQAAVQRTADIHDVMASGDCGVTLNIIDEQTSNWRATRPEPDDQLALDGRALRRRDRQQRRDPRSARSRRSRPGGIAMEDVVVAGIDATQDALTAMQAGELDVTVFQDAAGQGAGALDAALALARGERWSRRSTSPSSSSRPTTSRLHVVELTGPDVRGRRRAPPPPLQGASRMGGERRGTDADIVRGGRPHLRSRKRHLPQELNVFLALVLITLIFELLNRMNGTSFLFNVRDNVDAIFNQARLQIIILQVSITGIIAIGVTQVIILGGIDLSSGSVVGATAMIAMSFAQTASSTAPQPQGDLGRLGDGPAGAAPIAWGWACGLLAGSSTAAGRLCPHPGLHRHAGHDGGGARRGALVVERRARVLPNRGLCEPVERRRAGRDHLRAATRAGAEPGLIFLALAVLFQLLLQVLALRQALLCHRLQ
jgi:hypothetical protein